MKSIIKLKDEARRHEQKEEWEKAIDAYLQVLRIGDEGEGEVELPLYNRIGDLCVRLGRASDAVRYYEQAADRYAEVGLYNNAIALCNKVLRHRPDHLELIRKLGQFSALQGFLTEARQYFRDYADQQFRRGSPDAALAALTDFANIVDDGDARELLGRRLHDQGQRDPALTELRRAYALYIQSGDRARADGVRSVISTIDPNAAIEESAAPPTTASGTTGAADLPRLDDYDFAGAAATPDVADGGDSGFVADRVIDDLETETFSDVEVEASADIEVFGADEDDTADREPAGTTPELIDGLETTMLDFRAATAGLSAFDDLDIEADPSSFEPPASDAGSVAPSAGAASEPANDEFSFDLPLLDDEPGSAPLPLLDDERQAWTDPAADVGDADVDAPEDTGEPFSEPLPYLSDEPDETGPDDAARPDDFAYLPTFETDPAPLDPFAPGVGLPDWVRESVEAEPGAEPPWLDAEPDQVPLPDLSPDDDDAPWGTLPAVDAGEEDEDALDQYDEGAADGSAFEPISFDGLSLTESPATDDAGSDDEPLDTVASHETTSYEPSFFEPVSYEPISYDPVSDDVMPVEDASDDEVSGEAAAAPAPWDLVPESPVWDEPVPADLVQGASSAEPILDDMSEEWAAWEEPAAVDELDDDLASGAPTFEADDLDDIDDIDDIDDVDVDVAGDDIDDIDDVDDVDDVDIPIRTGRIFEVVDPDLEPDEGVGADEPVAIPPADVHGAGDPVEDEEWTPDSALAAGDATSDGVSAAEQEDDWEPWAGPGEAPAADAEPESVQPEGQPEPGAGDRRDGFVNLNDLLREDREETTRFRVSEAKPSGDEDRDFADLLGRFRAKISEHLPIEEAAAHYDLALAFKEMGLLDEAIAEFQIALRAGTNRLKIYEELGSCFVQKEEHAIAAKVLTYAVGLKASSELDLLGVYYHMGRAYEALGQVERAREAYEHVLAMDIAFHDVAERLTRL